MHKKVALGMSGGVDSSLSAHLLVEQGYDVTGVYLDCWREQGCSSDQERQDALKVALSLEIPFKVLNFTKDYQQKVVTYFYQEYQAGRTPNPDVLCNRDIKFGLFYDWAINNGFDYVATGHYAKIVEIDGKKQLAIPKDQHKDQTYFLHLIKGEQLNQILFPLADLDKSQVRAEAAKRSIHVAKKKDSVGVCFIGNVNVGQMLKEKLGENPGEVVDNEGNVIGSHRGLWFYTIGQRSGFTIKQSTLVKKSDGSVITKHHIPPFYVVAKDVSNNRLVVGFGEETLTNTFAVESISWINQKPNFDEQLMVRIRHTGDLLKVKSISGKDGRLIVKLQTPARGVSPGQSAVFYQSAKESKLCLGGGTLSSELAL